MKTLSEKDARKFHELFDPLLFEAFHKAYPGKSVITISSNSTQEIYKHCADYVYDHLDFLDKYIRRHSELSKDDKRLLGSFRKVKAGNYIIAETTDEGGILVDQNNAVYLAKGIVSDFEEMTAGFPLPLAVNTALLPFKDVIICDGLMSVYPVECNDELKQALKRTVQQAKDNHTIIRSFK